MMYCSPNSFAGVWPRTTPATDSRSVMAIPVYPSRAACSTSSSGWEAPRRNEKLLLQCNSTYCIEADRTVEANPRRIKSQAGVYACPPYRSVCRKASSLRETQAKGASPSVTIRRGSRPTSGVYDKPCPGTFVEQPLNSAQRHRGTEAQRNGVAEMQRVELGICPLNRPYDDPRALLPDHLDLHSVLD